MDEVTFVSKDDAFEEMKEKLKDNPKLFEDLPRNPFPHKLVVALNDPTLGGDGRRRVSRASILTMRPSTRCDTRRTLRRSCSR